MNLKNYKVLLNDLVAVNFKDQHIGSIPKWDAHLNEYIKKIDAQPHRAFSIFLFNSSNQLLLQRRSADKKTFPLCWTNTCCSHPNMIQFENKQIGVQNIRQSLHRALDRQLKMNLQKQNFYLVDKILYKAEGRENQQFGEYQMDYVYLCKLNNKNIEFKAVPEEVCQIQWIKKDELKQFVDKKQKLGCYFSPWFMKMFSNGLVQNWWNMAIRNELRNIGTQENIKIRQL